MDRAERRIALVGLADLAKDVAVGDEVIGILAIILALEFVAIAAGRIVGAARDPGAAGGVGFLGIVGVVALDADRDADRVVRELVDVAQRPAPANTARSTDDAVAIGIILRLDLALDAALADIERAEGPDLDRAGDAALDGVRRLGLIDRKSVV